MKIYILADMEGISGIRTERQVKQDPQTNDTTEYSAGRDLMVQDMNVAIAAAFEAGAEEAVELLTEVECAVVKWGIGRNRAKCLSLENAHSVIRKTVNDAIASLGKYKPYKPSLPATVELTMYRSDMADMLAVKSEVERVDARTVRKTISSLLDMSL